MMKSVKKREEWTGFTIFDLIAPFMDRSISLQVE